MKKLSIILFTVFSFYQVSSFSRSQPIPKYPKMCYAAKKEYHHFMSQYQQVAKQQYYVYKKVRILKHQRAQYIQIANKLLKMGNKQKARVYFKMAYQKLIHIRKLQSYGQSLNKKKQYLIKRVIFSKKKIGKYC